MPKASRDSLNAKGKRDVYMFDPEDLVLVTSEKSALYDERVDLPVNDGLVLNMMFAPDGVPQGVLESCLGRRNTETGKVEIVDGRQRVKAAREANKRLKKKGLETIRVPVMLQRAQDFRLMGMLISTNEHRAADSPLGRAKKAQRYLDLGRDESEIGALLGISPASVKNLLSLLDAPAAVRTAVESGKISISDGYKLARLEPAEAKVKVAELIEHAPRTPGKKRSKNAKKARAIVGGGKSAAVPAADANQKSASVREEWDTRKVEDRAATAIAEWIERTWNDETWSGSVKEIPAMIRAGDWREKAKAAE